MREPLYSLPMDDDDIGSLVDGQDDILSTEGAAKQLFRSSAIEAANTIINLASDKNSDKKLRFDAAKYVLGMVISASPGVGGKPSGKDPLARLLGNVAKEVTQSEVDDARRTVRTSHGLNPEPEIKIVEDGPPIEGEL